MKAPWEREPRIGLCSLCHGVVAQEEEHSTPTCRSCGATMVPGKKLRYEGPDPSTLGPGQWRWQHWTAPMEIPGGAA